MEACEDDDAVVPSHAKLLEQIRALKAENASLKARAAGFKPTKPGMERVSSRQVPQHEKATEMASLHAIQERPETPQENAEDDGNLCPSCGLFRFVGVVNVTRLRVCEGGRMSTGPASIPIAIAEVLCSCMERPAFSLEGQ